MRILFICTANLQRSVAAEEFLKKKLKEHRISGVEVESAGTSFGARTRVTREHIERADRIFVMEEHHLEHIRQLHDGAFRKTEVLEIPDIFMHKDDPELQELLDSKLAPLIRELRR